MTAAEAYEALDLIYDYIGDARRALDILYRKVEGTPLGDVLLEYLEDAGYELGSAHLLIDQAMGLAAQVEHEENE